MPATLLRLGDDTPWAVNATKKGDLPIAVEKRGQHKVTVVRNVEQPQRLASAIQKALGAGGSVSADGSVEVQGKLLPRVEAFLRSNPEQLKGVRREKPPAAAEDPGKTQDDSGAPPTAGEASASEERRRVSGKQRHVKAKTKTYVLAGANDDVVTATVRAAQAAGKAVGGWARCPHDWIYCTGRCDAPPSDDEDEDEDASGSCRDLITAQDALVLLPEENRLAFEPEPEPEPLHPSLRVSGGLNAALYALGMLSVSRVVDDRGKNRPSDKKVRVAERREERSAELDAARAQRAAERRSATQHWWPSSLDAAPTSAAAAATPAPAWMGASGSRAWASGGGVGTAREQPNVQPAVGSSAQRSCKRRPQSKKRLPRGGGGGGGGSRAGAGGARGAAGGRARPMWEDDLAAAKSGSRHEDAMQDDIDRHLFGGDSDDDDYYEQQKRGKPVDDEGAWQVRFQHTVSGAALESASAARASEGAQLARVLAESQATTGADAARREALMWPEEPLAAGPPDAYATLREGGEEAMAALVAAEGWQGQFGEIVADLGLGMGAFPWHVLAVRWLDGDSAEDGFIAALDTALREREASDENDEGPSRDAAGAGRNGDEQAYPAGYDGQQPEPEPELQQYHAKSGASVDLDEGLFFDDDHNDGSPPEVAAPVVAAPGAGRADAWAEAVDQLIELGFTDGAAIADALTQTNGRVEPALELLWAAAVEEAAPAPAAQQAKVREPVVIDSSESEEEQQEQEVEYRVDTADGSAYTKEEFQSEYGGLRQWDAARPVGAEPVAAERDWGALAAVGMDPGSSYQSAAKKKQEADKKKQEAAKKKQEAATKKQQSKQQPRVPAVEPSLQQLVDMGFPREKAVAALAQAEGDADAAMELLLAGLC